MKTTKLGLLLPHMVAVACSSPKASTPSAPAEARPWPTAVTFDRLPEGWDLHGHNPPPVSIDEAADGGGIERVHYWGVERAMVVEVIATRTGHFFVRSDCIQGHYDFPVGPFVGDPRVVLDARLPCLTDDLTCDTIGERAT